MTTIDFLDWLKTQLRSVGIRFALTSGQACVHFGIQQTTKDSDWIIDPNDIQLLRQLMVDWESKGVWQASYRAICGAPLDEQYLRHGWTSHLTVRESSASLEHHVDIFAKAPRVQSVETDRDDEDLASRHVVAQMKKTDREKDWPIVHSIGRQMLEHREWRGILHVQDSELLISNWAMVPEDQRNSLIQQRPLLALIDSNSQRLRRAIVIEKTLWSAVNQARYTVYQRAWKQFYRLWRRQAGMRWPLESPLLEQHEVLLAACQKHQLPINPFDERSRQAAIAQAVHDTAEIMAASTEELDSIAPPTEILLP